MRDDWQIVELGEVTAERKEAASLKSDSAYTLWSVPSFSDGQPESVRGNEIKSAKRRVENGDILLCKINPRINRVWVVENPYTHEQVSSTEWICLKPNSTKELSAHYLRYYLSSPSFREWIVSEISGATGSHTRAKPKKVMQQHVPLPPLPEQERIVSILDKAFEGIDKAIAQT